MLEKLRKYFRGYVRIRVTGKSPERFMNLCNAHHILLWDVEVQDLIYNMKISIADYRTLRPFVRKTGTKIRILEKQGMPFFIYKFRKRSIFFGGIVTCIIIVYSLSLFLWNIHIEGNVTQNTEQLIEYLEDIGVQHGVSKRKIVCEEIEKSLRTEFPNMLWVSVEIRGTRMIIQIKENEDQDIISKVEIKDDTPVSIAAENAGIVESMIVRGGTPMVSVGDEVTEGQILVEGYYLIKDDAGEIVKYNETKADADIFLLVYEEYTDCFSVSYTERSYTGKRRFGIILEIFEKQLPLLPRIGDKTYEETVIKKEIHVTENFYLPFSINLYQYLEYVEIEKEYTKNELENKAEERFLHKYENILQKGVQIIEKDVRIDNNDTLCKVGGSVKIRVPVTKKVPVVIPELSQDRSVEGEL